MAPRPITTWIFDIDGTLVDAQSGHVLRPLAATLLDALVARGDAVAAWSAGGADYALGRVTQHGLHHLVTSVHAKFRDRPADCWDLDGLPAPRVFVDDEPDPIPATERIIRVRPYIGGSAHDRGLAAVAEAAGLDVGA